MVGGGWGRVSLSVVWHGVPQGMVGDTVVPLGQLRSVDPDLYKTQKAKYAGREAVLDYRIPLLDCGFLDTVHCSSVHPHKIYCARREAGFEVPARSDTGWGIGLAFEIPLERILVETDSPFLAPVPFRGAPNSPALIGATYGFLAALRGVDARTVEEAVAANFRNFLPLLD